MTRGAKLALIGVGVLGGAAACAAMTLYASGFLFLAFNKVDPTQASLLSILDYWQWYRGTAADKKLKAAVLLSTVVFMLIVPIGVYAATRSKRSLHGDARFARAPEIEKAGLFVKDPKEPVILVGKFRERWLGLGGQRFVMLSAPTRSGVANNGAS